MIPWVLAFGLAATSVWLARALGLARRGAAEMGLRMDRLEQERRTREALFDAIVQESPVATMLLDGQGKIRFVNGAARRLFLGGSDVDEGASIADVLRSIPAPLKKALGGEVSELVSLDREEEAEVLLVGKRAFTSSETGTLTIVTAESMTSALMREELASYKRLLRVLSHELNNSLAPVASLASTGQRLAAAGTHAEIPALLSTIGERVEHLRTFLQRYGAISRLPSPRKADVELGPVLARLRRLFPGIAAPDVVGVAYVDESQLEQVLVNLVKNALEAESAPEAVELVVAPEADGGLRIKVRDRGHGLNDEALASALVPFFSTKKGGSGLGLAVCREIVEAHGGRLRIRGCEGGGAEVVLRLPGRLLPVRSELSIFDTR